MERSKRLINKYDVYMIDEMGLNPANSEHRKAMVNKAAEELSRLRPEMEELKNRLAYLQSKADFFQNLLAHLSENDDS